MLSGAAWPLSIISSLAHRFLQGTDRGARNTWWYVCITNRPFARCALHLNARVADRPLAHRALHLNARVADRPLARRALHLNARVADRPLARRTLQLPNPILLPPPTVPQGVHKQWKMEFATAQRGEEE